MRFKAYLATVVLLATVFCFVQDAKPACTSSIPTGIYAITPSTAQTTNYVPRPTITGQLQFFTYTNISPSCKTPDWSVIENHLNAWWGITIGGTTYYKPTILVFWLVPDGNNGPQGSPISPPNCFLAQLPAPQSIGQTQGCKLNNIPYYTSASYISQAQTAINLIKTHYANDQRVAFIQFGGLAGGGETFPICPGGQMLANTPGCNNTMPTCGFGMCFPSSCGANSWQTYMLTMLTVVGPAGTVHTVVPLNCFQYSNPGPCNDGGGVVSFGYPDGVAAAAEMNGAGIGTEGLTYADEQHYLTPNGTTANWYGNFQNFPTGIHEGQFNINETLPNVAQVIQWFPTVSGNVMELSTNLILDCAYKNGSCSSTDQTAMVAAINSFCSAVKC